jgi:hypothetical protein
MPTSSGPNTSGEESLVFAYDTGDITNSYIGEPTANLIPSANLNSYPTYGNSWGTYNTNRYYPFFSIGTVSSVSNNIVTTTGPHTMRSFDVLRPETNGGGVTTGTNYQVKRISDTQFSLHSYNSSQDGSQGYVNPATGQFKVHDSYWLDERVPINASNFPTSWVGEAHLPNAALVKEVIPGGFPTGGGRGTDCIRAHWFRTDGVTDGMAYGADASIIPGTPVYLSCWLKSVDANAVGKSINFYHYTYGVTGPTAYATGCTLGPVGVWQRFGYTFTSPNSAAISYWFPDSANMKVDIANIQIEQKNHATPFIAGTRTTTQGLLPVVGNSTIDLSNVSFDSNAQMTFDGTDDKVHGVSTNLSYLSSSAIEFIVTPESTGVRMMVGGYRHNEGYSSPTIGAVYIDTDNKFKASVITAAEVYRYVESTTTISANQTYHVVFNKDTTSGIMQLYINGIAQGAQTFNAATYGQWSSAGSYIGSNTLDFGKSFNTSAGQGWGGDFLNGKLPVVRLYSRTLTAQEVRQNYQQYKTRFNLS